MLEYGRPRLKVYEKNLRCLLELSEKQLSASKIKSSHSLSEDQVELLQVLSDLSTQFNRFVEQELDIPHLDSLVCISYRVRPLQNAREDLEKLLGETSIANDLYERIYFMGRLWGARCTFLALASASREFRRLRIHPVPLLNPRGPRLNPLSFSEACGILNLKPSEFIMGRYVSKNPEIEGNYTYRSTHDPVVHAEIQLIFHMAANDLKDIFPYIGGSKNNCFLCAAFIELYNNIETRGRHGHLYSHWTVPEFSRLPESEIVKVSAAIANVNGTLRRLLLDPLSAIPKKSIAESPIGPLTPPIRSNGLVTSNGLAAQQDPPEKPHGLTQDCNNQEVSIFSTKMAQRLNSLPKSCGSPVRFCPPLTPVPDTPTNTEEEQ
jgi:OTT_1508-like deaminase